MRTIFCLLLLTIAHHLVPSGTSVTGAWVHTIQAVGGGSAGSVAVLPDGRVCTVGSFSGSIDLVPETEEGWFTSQGQLDIYLQLLDDTGAPLWSFTIGGTGFDQAWDLEVTPEGIYVAGYFSGSVDFDPGPDAFLLQSVGNLDIFLALFSTEGELRWAKTIGGENVEIPYDLELDLEENIFLTGYFADTVDFDPGPNVELRTSVGLADVFVCKLDASGAFQWVKTFGGAGSDEGSKVTAAADGSLYLTGWYTDEVDVDPELEWAQMSSEGGTDAFVLKMSSNGELLWLRSLGGRLDDKVVDAAIGPEGNASLLVTFADTLSIATANGPSQIVSTGSDDVLVTKIDPDGQFLCTNTMGGTGFEQATGMAIGPQGEIYTTGFYRNTLIVPVDTSLAILPSAGGWDMYVQKIASDGRTIWATSFGSTAADQSRDISTDDYGYLYLIGDYYGSLTFGTAEGTINNEEGTGIFLLKQRGEELMVSTNYDRFSEIISVFPNPSSDVFQVRFSQLQDQVQLQVFDSNLQTLRTENHAQVDSINLNMGGYPSGVYFLLLQSGRRKEVHRLLLL